MIFKAIEKQSPDNYLLVVDREAFKFIADMLKNYAEMIWHEKNAYRKSFDMLGYVIEMEDVMKEDKR